MNYLNTSNTLFLKKMKMINHQNKVPILTTLGTMIILAEVIQKVYKNYKFYMHEIKKKQFLLYIGQDDEITQKKIGRLQS